MRTISDEQRRARIGVRHALAPGSRVATVKDAVVAMTCLHATEPANAYLSAWARSGASESDVDRALYVDRSVVRQLAMRRTVFTFPRELLPAVRGSASARVASQLSARLAKEVAAEGLADDGFAWVTQATQAVLDEVRRAPATTADLRSRIPMLDVRLGRENGGTSSVSIPIAPRVLSTLAADGRVVRGRNASGWKVSRPYWTAVEDWLDPVPDPLSEPEGYAELVSRWLWTFGPGTEADIVWWLGATKGAVRWALGAVRAVEVALEDETAAWMHPDDTEEVDQPAPWAALLPALDPTTMGWKERAFYLGPHAGLIFDRNGNGGPTAWWDGRIVGGWTQDDDGRVVVVPVEDLPSAARDALEIEAARLPERLDGDLVRSIYQSPLVRSRS